MKKIILFAVMMIFGFWGIASADILVLKGGKKIEGKIVEEDSYSVKIMVRDIPNMFYRYQIEEILYEEELKAEESQQEAEKFSAREKELLLRFFEINGMSQDIRKIIDNITKNMPGEIQGELKKTFKAEDIIQRLLPVYAKNFTEEEIEELINFYQTPTGQKQLDLAPKLFDETMRIVGEYFKEKKARP